MTDHPADAMGSVGSLTRDERAGLAARPDWSPVLDRTAESCNRLLDQMDADVLRMLGDKPKGGAW